MIIRDRDQNDFVQSVQNLMAASHDISIGWDEVVQETLVSLSNDNQLETLWPRDSLFKYLQLMENLMGNLREYQELNVLACKKCFSLELY